MEHALIVAALLFGIGLFGLMLRRNIIFMLMALEVMLNGAALAFIAAAAHWGNPDGQVMFLFILSIAAAGGLCGPRACVCRCADKFGL